MAMKYFSIRLALLVCSLAFFYEPVITHSQPACHAPIQGSLSLTEGMILESLRKERWNIFFSSVYVIMNLLDPVSERFRQTSTDITRPRVDYRGPLLQRFHSGEFSSKPELSQQPYAPMGPSPYDQVSYPHEMQASDECLN